jgi:hypothetical protein
MVDRLVDERVAS